MPAQPAALRLASTSADVTLELVSAEQVQVWAGAILRRQLGAGRPLGGWTAATLGPFAKARPAAASAATALRPDPHRTPSAALAVTEEQAPPAATAAAGTEKRRRLFGRGSKSVDASTAAAMASAVTGSPAVVASGSASPVTSRGRGGNAASTGAVMSSSASVDAGVLGAPAGLPPAVSEFDVVSSFARVRPAVPNRAVVTTGNDHPAESGSRHGSGGAGKSGRSHAPSTGRPHPPPARTLSLEARFDALQAEVAHLRSMVK